MTARPLLSHAMELLLLLALAGAFLAYGFVLGAHVEAHHGSASPTTRIEQRGACACPCPEGAE